MDISGRKSTKEFIRTTQDADQILRQFRIYEPPVSVSVIKKIFKQCTIDRESFGEEWMGFSYPDPEKAIWRILINDRFPITSQRFTAFHELYHMIEEKPNYCRASTENRLEESLANHFAASLLMPARWVRKYWEKYEDVNALAGIFIVSPQAVEIRLKNLEHYLSA